MGSLEHQDSSNSSQPPTPRFLGSEGIITEVRQGLTNFRERETQEELRQMQMASQYSRLSLYQDEIFKRISTPERFPQEASKPADTDTKLPSDPASLQRIHALIEKKLQEIYESIPDLEKRLQHMENQEKKEEAIRMFFNETLPKVFRNEGGMHMLARTQHIKQLYIKAKKEENELPGLKKKREEALSNVKTLICNTATANPTLLNTKSIEEAIARCINNDDTQLGTIPASIEALMWEMGIFKFLKNGRALHSLCKKVAETLGIQEVEGSYNSCPLSAHKKKMEKTKDEIKDSEKEAKKALIEIVRESLTRLTTEHDEIDNERAKTLYEETLRTLLQNQVLYSHVIPNIRPGFVSYEVEDPADFLEPLVKEAFEEELNAHLRIIEN